MCSESSKLLELVPLATHIAGSRMVWWQLWRGRRTAVEVGEVEGKRGKQNRVHRRTQAWDKFYRMWLSKRKDWC